MLDADTLLALVGGLCFLAGLVVTPLLLVFRRPRARRSSRARWAVYIRRMKLGRLSPSLVVVNAERA